MEDIFNKLSIWFSNNYGWVISILIQGFIAYHIFFLSKRLTNKEKLKHKEKVKDKTENLLSKIRREELNSEVYLVNINRYFKDYPSNEEKKFEGYSHIKAEIKSTRFDGVQFFSAMPIAVYKKPNGELSLDKDKGERVFNAFPVSVVPYEAIEYVDPEGDEYGCVPLFYCKFQKKINWKFWEKPFIYFSPYKKTVYYKESEVYNERNDPLDMKYRKISIS